MSSDEPITEAAIVRALAHPLRVQILNVLEQRAASPSELAEELGAPLGNLSYHMRTLASLGVIKLVNKKQRRGAIEHYYRAERRPLVVDESWQELPDIVKTAMVDANLSETVAQVREAAEAGGFNRREAHLTRTVADLDEQGWNELSEAMAESLQRVREIVDRAAERLDDRVDDHDLVRFRATAVLMLFERGAVADGAAPDGRKPARARKRATADREA